MKEIVIITPYQKIKVRFKGVLYTKESYLVRGDIVQDKQLDYIRFKHPQTGKFCVMSAEGKGIYKDPTKRFTGSVVVKKIKSMEFVKWSGVYHTLKTTRNCQASIRHFDFPHRVVIKRGKAAEAELWVPKIEFKAITQHQRDRVEFIFDNTVQVVATQYNWKLAKNKLQGIYRKKLTIAGRPLIPYDLFNKKIILFTNYCERYFKQN